MKKAKPKVKVAGVGTVDECECCNAKFVKGVACWLIDPDIEIDLCFECLEKKFEEV